MSVRDNCPWCGIRMVKTNLKGQEFPYKHHKAVKLTYDLVFPQCPNQECREMVLTGHQLKALDHAIERSLNEQVA